MFQHGMKNISSSWGLGSNDDQQHEIHATNHTLMGVPLQIFAIEATKIKNKIEGNLLFGGATKKIDDSIRNYTCSTPAQHRPIGQVLGMCRFLSLKTPAQTPALRAGVWACV